MSASSAALPSSSRSAAEATRQFGRGARVLSVGIALTGLLTLVYFSLASHVLTAVEAKRVDLLWSVMFVIISVIYRPIEQLLSRTIADRVARGHAEHPLRAPMLIQGSFALIFLIAALALRPFILDHALSHSDALYDVLVVGTLAYAASYFARGWLAGHKHFALYGGLVFMEASTRVCFALAVAIGIASGQTAVALGIAAAPLMSLVVVPAAFATRRVESDIAWDDGDAALEGPAAGGVQEANRDDLSLRGGTGFAVAVSAIMLSEQTILNAAVLTIAATSSSHILAGIVFNVLLIARAPLQLFQAIQTSLLPHLAGLEATAGREAFRRAVRITVTAIGGFALAVALGLLAIGPLVLGHVFGQAYSYGRIGLALMGIGMGLHLASGTLNQAALARDRARAAAACWLTAALAFVVWTVIPLVHDELLRVEIGYAAATGLLALLLWGLYRRDTRAAQPAPAGRLGGAAFS